MSSNIKGYNGTLATRLRGLMEDSKTTQIELAKSLGVSRQSVSQYMDGSMQPNAEKLSNIAKFFNVSSDYLLGRTDAKSYSADLIKVCNFTGLDEEFVKHLKNSDFRRLETINIMFKDNFIQNLIKFIDDEISVLVMKHWWSRGLCGICASRDIGGKIFKEIELESKDIENYFEEEIREIKIKVIDKCGQNMEKVLKDVFDSRKKKTLNAMSEEVFNEAMKKILLEHYINDKAFLYRNQLSKIYSESNDGQKAEERK